MEQSRTITLIGKESGLETDRMKPSWTNNGITRVYDPTGSPRRMIATIAMIARIDKIARIARIATITMNARIAKTPRQLRLHDR